MDTGETPFEEEIIGPYKVLIPARPTEFGVKLNFDDSATLVCFELFSKIIAWCR